MHTGIVLDDWLKRFIGYMMPRLEEDDRRFFVAILSQCLGYGSATEISELTGISERTISKAKKEFNDAPNDPRSRPKAVSGKRIRAEGGGRKKIVEKQPEIKQAIEKLVEPSSYGNPENPLRWTVKSLRTIESELKKEGFEVSFSTVGSILTSMGYSLQQNKKYLQVGEPGPDRNAQFEFINDEARRFMESNLPVISIDAKKKELIGNYKNNGAEIRPVKEPRLVNDHDFEGEDGKAIPYGVYDIHKNEGFINVGISADTAEFAVNSISSWWYLMGQYRYPDAKEIMITADGGGSNGSHNRLWKTELQNFADISGMTIHMRHFPPGTSKWNKIEHRLFSFISKNWKGVPLESLEIVVNLIGSTTNSKGLKVKCIVDDWEYETGRKVSNQEFETINIIPSEWRGDWNYTIMPRE